MAVYPGFTCDVVFPRYFYARRVSVYRGTRLSITYADGYANGYVDGFADGVASVPPPPSDDPPVVTVVSPLPGVAPGDPGGFPLDPEAAKTTPVVLDVDTAGAAITDLVVLVRFLNLPGNVEVVYYRGNFCGLYVESTKENTVTGFQLTVKRAGGWFLDGQQSSLEFVVDALKTI